MLVFYNCSQLACCLKKLFNVFLRKLPLLFLLLCFLECISYHLFFII